MSETPAVMDAQSNVALPAEAKVERELAPAWLIAPYTSWKRRLATCPPESLLARAIVLYLVCSGLREFAASATQAPTHWVNGVPMDGNPFAGSSLQFLVVWVLHLAGSYFIIQMIWAGLRLIADAIAGQRLKSHTPS